MTREEAIAIIENEKKCVNRANKNDYCNRDCYNCELVKTDIEILDALNMAIKALEQQPCSDVISRQAVLDKKELVELEDGQSFYCISSEDVETLPPVTPQQEMGRWILTQRDKCIDISCSECGNVRFKDYAYGYTIDELDLNEVNDLLVKIQMNYCECCGAKMQEVQG